MNYLPDKVYLTKSGLFARIDQHVGMLIFSPYTGLVFVVHSKDTQSCLRWIDQDGDPPGDTIRQAIGLGWDKSVEQANYPVPHYLSEQGTWERFPAPTLSPILINWFITGVCPLSCQYCDAQDVMSTTTEPTIENIQQIVSRILVYKPLAVVLTGGEPLTSPHLEKCIEILYGHTGIMVDTNAIFLNRDILTFLKKFRVVVRVSLDSPIPRVNDQLRRSTRLPNMIGNQKSALEAAVEAISLCLDNDVPLAVQTVASKKNWNDLPELGLRLYRLGVKSWRVHLVSINKQSPKYKILVVPLKSRKEMLQRLTYIRKQSPGLDLQIIDDVSRDSVVIISPDGRFLTESATGKGKILIDPERPFEPARNMIFTNVSAENHARRYLGSDESFLGRWLSGK
jgi:MoaA/NifB/PqqE/SkfB family radical SAM enzyme